MTIEAIPEYDEPRRGRNEAGGQQADATLLAGATATIKRLLDEHPVVGKEIKEILRTRVHLQELTRRRDEDRGSLHHMLYPWALSSAAPEGVDHAKWTAALDQAIDLLFPAP